MHIHMARSRLFQAFSHRPTIGMILSSLLISMSVAQDNPESAFESQPDESIPTSPLVTSEFPGTEWTFFSGKKDSKFSETWKFVTDPDTKTSYIACTGQPYGYIRTKKLFRNFDFGLEWRFPKDENGNSGVLLFTSGDDRIWPTSMQVQLQQPLAGSSFPSGSAKSANELRNVPMLSRPVNQWNKCLISAREGTVTIVVNDQKVGAVQGCQPLEGAISLQSEGSEIHFRNIWIREYPAKTEPVGKAESRREMRNQRIPKPKLFLTLRETVQFSK